MRSLLLVGICKLASCVLNPFNLTAREKSKAERVILDERSYYCETSQTWYQVSHLFFLVANPAATVMQQTNNIAQIRSAKCNVESVLPREKHHRVTLFLSWLRKRKVGHRKWKHENITVTAQLSHSPSFTRNPEVISDLNSNVSVWELTKLRQHW